jgi:hypothetical protein
MEQSSVGFEWYGKRLTTMGEVMEEALHLLELDDPLLLTEFIDDYGTYLEGLNPEKDGRELARQNLGYMAGYYDQEIATQVYNSFECEHPIFGREFPSPEEAFEKGKEWGEAIKRGKPYPQTEDLV